MDQEFDDIEDSIIGSLDKMDDKDVIEDSDRDEDDVNA